MHRRHAQSPSLSLPHARTHTHTHTTALHRPPFCQVYGERTAEFSFKSFANSSSSSSSSHPAPRRIPYQHNRCVVFDSRLLHETVPVKFEPGFGQERISVTILFGDEYGISKPRKRRR